MSASQASQPRFRLRAPKVDKLRVAPSSAECYEHFTRKYTRPAGLGPSPALRLRHGFLAADDYYEMMVGKLVRTDAAWLDVGCGRDVFPSYYEGAKQLAQRCSLFVGIDPDPNVHENALLTERFQGTIEDYETSHRFDLLTLRMVAEHVERPERSVRKLAELSAPGGLVVIYTPWRWSPMSLIASVVPFSLHNRLKRLVWDSEPQDTFPTVYGMNSRARLNSLFEAEGFEEAFFVDLDDCSIFTRYPALNSAEIFLRNVTLAARVPYPEHCLFAIFRRRG
jgi:SAM-dependent methyltransferase